MNYYEARQTKDKLYWRWTCMNDRQIWTSTPCTEDCKHQTKEEAERHYYDHLVASLRTVEFQSAQKCAVCGAWTPKGLQPAKSMEVCHLCDEHLAPENWQKEFPFKIGTQITSSM